MSQERFPDPYEDLQSLRQALSNLRKLDPTDEQLNEIVQAERMAGAIGGVLKAPEVRAAIEAGAGTAARVLPGAQQLLDLDQYRPYPIEAAEQLGKLWAGAVCVCAAGALTATAWFQLERSHEPTRLQRRTEAPRPGAGGRVHPMKMADLPEGTRVSAVVSQEKTNEISQRILRVVVEEFPDVEPQNLLAGCLAAAVKVAREIGTPLRSLLHVAQQLYAARLSEPAPRAASTRPSA